MIIKRFSGISFSNIHTPTLQKPLSVGLTGFFETNEKYHISDIKYTTRDGHLLEVEHDMDALAQITGQGWRKLFDRRVGKPFYPLGSGVWGKKEWILPHIPNEDVISFGEGNSNLMKATQFSKRIGMKHVWIKQCGISHSGSFKDLGMTVLISHVNNLMKNGSKIRAVGCASSGDTSAAVSAYSSAVGIPSVVFLPAGKISPSQLIQPISNGSLVLCLDTDFDGCMECIKQIVQECPIYLANSMNPLRLEGQKTVSVEILQQLSWEVPNTVIIPGGNLGNVYALWKGFNMCKHLGLINNIPRLIVSQTEKANPLYQAYQNGLPDVVQAVKARKTFASAIQIGNPVSYPRARKALLETNGIVEQCTEEELMDAGALGDQNGMFNCPHTGTSLAVLLKLLKNGRIQKDERVVVVSTAHGLKFTESKTRYHLGQLVDLSCQLKNPMKFLPPKPEDILAALKERFKI